MGLAHAAGAEQQQVLSTVLPAGVVGDLLDLMAIEIGDRTPFLVRQGLRPGQLGLMEQAPQPPPQRLTMGAVQKNQTTSETAGLNATELGDYCRERGLFPEQVDRWR